MKKTILFDLDGTLIDSTEAILESFESAFKAFGQDVPKSDEITAQIGYPLDVMFSRLGVDEDKIWDYVAAYKMHYQEIACEKTTLLPGAREAVELASTFATLGVVTTKTGKYSIELLENMNLMSYFDVLIGREDVTNPKPDPEPILKALQTLPKDTLGIWMIGDTCMDMQSATRANVESVGLTCGYGTEESLKKCTSNIEKNAFDAVSYISNI
ncbi:Phosphoglycolate phosphatase [hydrothermal vent metagenome]|uniref:Phosphoglycolate phosphatase n=1 Tax=hydrothermal vent metagenome TaxID=652676 RepID=A0A1W1EGB0_9ZZZZ